MHSLYKALPLLVLFLLAGCGNTPETPPSEPTPEPITFRLVGQGQQALLGATELLIHDAETWRLYADSLRPVQPFDSVDFTEEMILLAAVPEPEAGHSVVFETVVQTPDSLVARYVVSEPADDCPTTPVATVPFQVIRLPRTEGPVRFEHETEPYRCTTNRDF